MPIALTQPLYPAALAELEVTSTLQRCSCYIPGHDLYSVASFIGRELSSLGTAATLNLVFKLKDKLWMPSNFTGHRGPSSLSPMPGQCDGSCWGWGRETMCHRTWWDLEMSYPSLTHVFSRVLQELKRRNEKRMAGSK